MDHLTYPQNAPQPYNFVPYLGTSIYDNDSFQGYPARQGWNKDGLFAGDFFQCRDRDAAAAFLQTWLYFGPLYELSVASGRSAPRPRDFIKMDGRRSLLTAVTLDKFVFRCIEHIKTFHASKEKHALEALNDVLDTTCTLTKQLFNLYHVSAERSPLPIDAIFSIMVLGSTIDLGLRTELKVPVTRSWGLSDFAKAKMFASGWCRRDIALASAHLSELSMFYASHLVRDTAREDHQVCTEHVCEANQIHDKYYMTRHRMEDCTCEFWESNEEDLQQIIREDRIPYIELRRNKKPNTRHATVDVSLKSLNDSIIDGSHRHLVVFSHVWSDGLGNPQRNALPLCQLQYFYDLLCDSSWNDTVAPQHGNSTNNSRTVHKWMRSTTRRPVRIWIDTLCVPREQETRMIAITNLKRYYSNASMTVALDGTLSSLPYKHLSHTEALLRIALSNWMRRCWTMQEAIIAGDSTRIQFADGWFNLSDQVASSKLKGEIGSYLMNGKQQDEIKTSRSVMATIMASMGLLACLPPSTSEKRAHRESPKRLHKSEHFNARQDKTTTSRLVRTEVEGMFDTIMDLIAEGPTGKPTSPPVMGDRVHRILLAWRGLSYRTTSRASDRFINFAYACATRDQDFESLKDILALPSAERLQAWLLSRDVLPCGMLFAAGPKMEEPGFRWAPSDIHPGEMMDEDIASCLTEKRHGSGAPRGSLQLRKPGIMLGKSLPSTRKIFEIVLEEAGSRYLVNLDHSASKAIASERPSQSWALVFSTFRPDQSTMSAVLISQVTRHGNAYVGVCCGTAGVTNAEMSGPGKITTTRPTSGQLLPQTQEWIIS